MSVGNRAARAFRTMIDILFFRRPSHDPRTLGADLFLLGLLCTWIAGIGRYWDNPRADLWQYAGLGSVAYIFILSALLWVMVAPLRPRDWTYFKVLTFVSVTSLPAILYAIPVELFMSPRAAGTANMLFLLAVATWRVALLYRFLSKAAGLAAGQVFVATFLPLTLIVTALSILNLEHVVFDLMAGIAEEDRSVNDAAYNVLLLITMGSMLLFPPLLIAYAVMAAKAWRTALDERGERR